MKTIVLLFCAEGNWWLGTYKGDTIPSSGPHATARSARKYAKLRGWGVKRTPSADDL